MDYYNIIDNKIDFDDLMRTLLTKEGVYTSLDRFIINNLKITSFDSKEIEEIIKPYNKKGTLTITARLLELRGNHESAMGLFNNAELYYEAGCLAENFSKNLAFELYEKVIRKEREDNCFNTAMLLEERLNKPNTFDKLERYGVAGAIEESKGNYKKALEFYKKGNWFKEEADMLLYEEDDKGFSEKVQDIISAYEKAESPRIALDVAAMNSEYPHKHFNRLFYRFIKELERKSEFKKAAELYKTSSMYLPLRNGNELGAKYETLNSIINKNSK